MSQPHNPAASHHPLEQYEICIKGHLDQLWSDWFEGFAIALMDNGETRLSGSVVDQAALYGLLIKVRDLGLPLVSVMPTQTKQTEIADKQTGETMNLQKQILTIETKAKLSALWMFFLLNTIFRDIHEFIEPGFIEQVMTGTFNGIQITEPLLLFGGFVAEVPIAMVLFSRLLPYGANRWTNIIAAVITLGFEINNGTTDLDDTFHMVIEMAALSFIIWSAWRWRNPIPQSSSTAQKA